MLKIRDTDYELTAIRAQGAGGQNVNKVSSAIQLRFDIRASSLSGWLKARLLESKDKRITKEGVLIIKAQQYRTQEANKRDAIKRLHEVVNVTNHVMPARRQTKPSYGSKQRRLKGKAQRGQIKALRRRPSQES